MSEIPKRPVPGTHTAKTCDFALSEHEHAIAKALWEALWRHHRDHWLNGRRVTPYCAGCDDIERVKASGWVP
jgi:hypothetical protein